jgi:osmotically-inducible protein OsmY
MGIGGACFAAALAHADERIQLDPFAQATNGDVRCPEQSPPLLTLAQARAEAHVRSERGLRCAMEGKCEEGGAYKRDPEINDRVRAAIAGHRRFAATSVWVTTSRKWVTLQGCVRSASLRKALVAFVARQSDVERVFDELAVRP